MTLKMLLTRNAIQVVVAGSSWEDLLSGAQKLFFTVYPHLCKEKYIENCTFGKWKTKRDNEESVDDPGLSFECGKYL